MAPNPQASSAPSADRPYHGNGRPAVVASRGERPPGTPRREKGHGRESSAVQDPGLKDYVSYTAMAKARGLEGRRKIPVGCGPVANGLGLDSVLGSVSARGPSGPSTRHSTGGLERRLP